jgi:hypothetical protein
MAAPPPPPKGGGMSLYANLLDPKAGASATVSGAPVVYHNGEKDDAAVAKKDAISGTSRRTGCPLPLFPLLLSKKAQLPGPSMRFQSLV